MGKRASFLFLWAFGPAVGVSGQSAIRLGVRGGLDGFFMDAFAAFGYAIGGSIPTERYGMDRFVRKPLSGAEFRAGINFGLGWDGRSH